VAELRMMEVRVGAVSVGGDESRDERPLTPPLRESVGSDDSVGRMFVMLASIEPGELSPRLDGRPDRDDGRLVSNVICENDVPIRLLIPDAPEGRVVIEPGRVVTEPRSVVMEPRRDDIEVRGFVTNVVALGMLSGPIFTARLDTKTTVLVPLRRVPVDNPSNPLVKVHSPSV
jgi:hypothetical protein